MIIGKKDYFQKILGCWMGKNIGGTLGAPFEWKRQINNIKYYEQELGGEPLPNDDLDIPLLWLIALEERGINIDSKVLADYWQLYVTPHWVEYGTAKINMKSGLMPPLCGILNNSFKDSNGCYIRSEIWACISPGCPEIAVKLAYEDAIIDHGDGEGMYAEIFCTALESTAFVVSDLNQLINIGLSFIPDSCGVSKAIKNVVNSYKSGKTWLESREEILKKYRGAIKPEIFDGKIGGISKEEEKKGFKDGKVGYDAPLNIGMILIGLLYGEGDFSKSITTTVNCGEDTDSTAATCGAILGIINGIDNIPKEWKDPIGKKIKTAILNIGELGIYGDQLPGDIDELAGRIWKITQQLILEKNLNIEILEEKETDLKDNTHFLSEESLSIYKNLSGPTYHFDFFDVMVDYTADPSIEDNVPKRINLTFENKYKIQEIINVHWYLPDDWKIKPSTDCRKFIKCEVMGSNTEKIEFEIIAEKVAKNINRCVVELTFEGRQTVMLIPIVLLNGNQVIKS